MAGESRLQAQIQRALERRGAWVVKIHGGPFQPAAIDLLACYRGRFIGIEVKVPGGQATPRQVYTMMAIQHAGGRAIVARTVQEALAVLEQVDYECGEQVSSIG